MKICIAQTRPVKGDIRTNIINHKKLIDLAASYEAGVIIFPELSLTGYEPELAKALATDQDDVRFDDFQTISDSKQITIGVGVPLKNDSGVCISMIIFQPNKARETYSKRYLHLDEEPFFVSGRNLPCISINKTTIALAICYELSVPEHAEDAFKSGARIYIASVAKFINGIDKAIDRLSGIAKDYSMTVFMSNCVGQADGNECAGKSSIWNSEGKLIGQLESNVEGILMVDLNTNQVTQCVLG